MKYPPINIGDTFGKWVVVGEAARSKTGLARLLCRCECGAVAYDLAAIMFQGDEAHLNFPRETYAGLDLSTE